MNPETRHSLMGWMRQFGVLLAAYLALLAVTRWQLSASHGSLRTALILMPIVPGLALLWQTVRSYRRCDEYIRSRIAQAGALSALIVAAFALVYFFLELLGEPRLSTAWIFNLVWVVFVAQMIRLIATGK